MESRVLFVSFLLFLHVYPPLGRDLRPQTACGGLSGVSASLLPLAQFFRVLSAVRRAAIQKRRWNGDKVVLHNTRTQIVSVSVLSRRERRRHSFLLLAAARVGLAFCCLPTRVGCLCALCRGGASGRSSLPSRICQQRLDRAAGEQKQSLSSKKKGRNQSVQTRQATGGTGRGRGRRERGRVCSRSAGNRFRKRDIRGRRDRG